MASKFGLKAKEQEGVKFLFSPELFKKYSVLVVFTTRLGGVSPPPFNSLNLAFHTDDRAENVVKNRKLLCKVLGLKFKNLTAAEQVHRDLVVEVTKDMKGRGALSENSVIASADALVTKEKNVPLILFFADCVPLILADPLKRLAGVIHAGRAGTDLGIAKKTAKFMEERFAVNLKDVLVFIGPSICASCYGRDLVAENKFQLEKVGVLRKNIISTNLCTACNNELFFSYRKEKGRTGRQCALVALL